MQREVRLDKLLAGQGYGTRGEVRVKLRHDCVRVNGEIVRDGAVHVDPAVDSVTIDDETVITSPAPIVMMNKPTGVLTANGDGRHSTVVDLLPDKWRSRRLMPIGRLDLDTTGLLLFTDDGDLAHRLISPKRNVDKLYHVLLDMPITDDDIDAFAHGVSLGGYMALPAKLLRDPENINGAFITIHEGKYHQVKRMFASRAHTVAELMRLEFGPIKLDKMLRPGASRALKPCEEAALRAACNAVRQNTLGAADDLAV